AHQYTPSGLCVLIVSLIDRRPMICVFNTLRGLIRCSSCDSGCLATRKVNLGLLAVAGHDFHRKAGFYDVAIEMEVASLSAAAVLGNLRYGRFTIRARFFRCSAQADFSSFQASRLLFLSWQISGLRAVRDLLLR